MDENLHSIDDLFRKSLNEYEDTPSAKVTENIEKHLQKKRVVSITKKYKRWKWVAAALLIFSVGMGMYTINLRMRYKEATGRNKVKNPSAKSHVISSDKSFTIDKNKQDSFAKSSNENHVSLSRKGLSAPDKNDSTKEVIDNKVVQHKSAPGLLQRTGNAGLTSNNQDQSSHDVRTNHAHIKSVAVTDKNNVKAIKQVDALHKTTEAVNANNSNLAAAGKQESNRIKNQDNSNKDSKNETLNKIEQPTNLPLVQRINLNDFLANKTSNLLNMQPASHLQITQSTGMLNANLLPSSAAVKNIKLKVPGAKKFSANVFVSVDNVATHLTNDHPAFREDDKNKIKHDEDRSNAYTAGVLGQLMLTNKVGIEAGFSLSTITTDIHSKTIFARPDNRGNIGYRISCSSGYAYVSAKSGPRPNQGDSLTALSSKNTLQYLSVPIGLQYVMSFGKFELRPAFVISTNIRTKSKVETLLSTAGANENTATNTIEGLKPVYFDAGPRLDAIYNLSRVIGIGFTPSARFALSSSTKDGPVKTYLNSFGLAATVKIKL